MKVRQIIRDLTKKRTGIHLYRPVMNASAWIAWLEKIGVPNLVKPEQMKVTVLAAAGAVAMVRERGAYAVDIPRGAFARWGPEGRTLVFVWDDWQMMDRHWRLRGVSNNCGCVLSCEFRAMLVLSTDAGDFDFTDEMLDSAPFSIVLDGELTEDLPGVLEVLKAKDEVLADPPTADEQAAAAAALAKALANPASNPLDIAAYRDMAAGRPVLKATAEELTEPVELEKALTVRDVMYSRGGSERQTNEAELVKRSNEERIAYGWASVTATTDGEVVVDGEDMVITIEAQKDLLHGLIRGQRAGNIDHDILDGEPEFELVEGLVFTPDLWKALEPYWGQTGTFIGMHAPTEEAWKATEGRDMFSIGCRGVVEDVEEP